MTKILALIFLVLPAVIFSQVPNTTYISGFAGYSIPSIKERTDFKNSFHAGMKIEKDFTNTISAGVEAGYSRFTSSLSNSPAIVDSSIMGTFSGGNLTLGGVMAYVKFFDMNVSNVFQPYLKLGAGASIISYSGSTLNTDSTSKEVDKKTSGAILLSAGAGLDIQVSGNNKLFIEVQYRMNKNGADDVRNFLINLGYGFRL